MSAFIYVLYDDNVGLINNYSDADVSECLKSLIAALEIDLTIQPNIVFARDTRYNVT